MKFLLVLSAVLACTVAAPFWGFDYLLHGIENGVGGAINGVEHAVKTLEHAAVNTVGGVAHLAKNVVNTAVNTVDETVKEVGDHVVKPLVNGVTDAAADVIKTGGHLIGAGKIVDPLANGIRDGVQNTVSAVTNGAEDVTGAAAHATKEVAGTATHLATDLTVTAANTINQGLNAFNRVYEGGAGAVNGVVHTVLG